MSNQPDVRAMFLLPPRFLAKIRTTSTGCWVWAGATSGGRRPYGVTWDGVRRVKAHRFAYTLAVGPIPDGLQLDHLCKTPLCVRPSHLEPVTLAENVRRSDAPGALAVRTNHCKRGHEFTPENTYIKRDGTGRQCRVCQRASNAAYKARKRVAA